MLDWYCPVFFFYKKYKLGMCNESVVFDIIRVMVCEFFLFLLSFGSIYQQESFIFSNIYIVFNGSE